MKITNKKTTITETFTINYGSGFKCNVIIVDGNITNYTFYKDKLRLTYTTKIDILKNTVWYEYTQDMLTEKTFTLEELKKFNQFSNLFYIGGGMDGLIRDNNGNLLQTRIRANDSDTSIFMKVNPHKNIDAYRKLLKKLPWVFNISETGLLVFDMILPDDLFDEMINSYQYPINGNSDIVVFALHKIRKMYKESKKVTI